MEVDTSVSKKKRSRSRFTPEEDEAIRKSIEKNGRTAWSRIATSLPNRTPRQISERWLNYLAPEVSRRPWTPEEDAKLLRTVEELGRSWSVVAKRFNGRTDVTVKNRYKLLSRRGWVNVKRQVEVPRFDSPQVTRSDELPGMEWEPLTWKLPRWELNQLPPLK